MTATAPETNGTPPNPRERLRDARRNMRALNAEIQAKRLERQYQLLRNVTESITDVSTVADWTYAYSDLISRYRQEPTNFQLSTTYDRRYGRNYPMFQTETELALLRMPSRIMCSTNPYAQGLLTGLRSYVIGQRYSYRVSAKRRKNPPPELIDACQSIVDNFLRRNGWCGGADVSLEHELFWRSCEDGEFILLHHKREDGQTDVRTIEPEQLRQPPGTRTEEYLFGVRTPPEDVQTVEGYWIAWGNDPANGDEHTPEEVTHFKRNVKRSIKRGLPDFTFDTWETLDTASKLRRALGLGAAIQASIVGVREHQAATAAQVQSFADALADYQKPDLVTGSSINTKRYAPGTWEDMPQNTKYVQPPGAANAQPHLEVLQGLLRAASVRWNAPEWLGSGLHDTSSFASSLTAESPFVRTVLAEQERYKEAFVRSPRIALQNWVECRDGLTVTLEDGRVLTFTWQDIEALVEIVVEAPSAEVRNKLDEAQANQIRVQGGWKARQTVMQEEGLDVDQQLALMDEWQEREGPPESPLRMPPDEPPEDGGPGDEPPEPKPPQPKPQDQEQTPVPESRLLEMKDASGHEHAADGKFGSEGGSGGEPSKPKLTASEQAKHEKLKKSAQRDADASQSRRHVVKSQATGLWVAHDEDLKIHGDHVQVLSTHEPGKERQDRGKKWTPEKVSKAAARLQSKAQREANQAGEERHVVHSGSGPWLATPEDLKIHGDRVKVLHTAKPLKESRLLEDASGGRKGGQFAPGGGRVSGKGGGKDSGKKAAKSGGDSDKKPESKKAEPPSPAKSADKPAAKAPEPEKPKSLLQRVWAKLKTPLGGKKKPKQVIDPVKARLALAKHRLATYEAYSVPAKEHLADMGVANAEKTDLHKSPDLRHYAVNNPAAFDAKIAKVEESLQRAGQSAQGLSPELQEHVSTKLAEIGRLKADVAKFREAQQPEIAPDHRGKRGAGHINIKAAADHLAAGGTVKSAVVHVMKTGGVKEATAKRYVREAVKHAAAQNEAAITQAKSAASAPATTVAAPAGKSKTSGVKPTAEQAAADLKTFKSAVLNPEIDHKTIAPTVQGVMGGLSPKECREVAKGLGISRTLPNKDAAIHAVAHKLADLKGTFDRVTTGAGDPSEPPGHALAAKDAGLALVAKHAGKNN